MLSGRRRHQQTMPPKQTITRETLRAPNPKHPKLKHSTWRTPEVGMLLRRGGITRSLPTDAKRQPDRPTAGVMPPTSFLPIFVMGSDLSLTGQTGTRRHGGAPSERM